NPPSFSQWREWCRRDRIEDIKNKEGILQHFVLMRSRVGVSLTDNALYINDPELSASVLQWRKGTSALTRGRAEHLCKCGQRYNKGHINRCNLFRDFNVLNEGDWVQWREDLEEIFKDGPHTGHYTILDTLLNNKDYTRFNQCLMHLKENLA